MRDGNCPRDGIYDTLQGKLFTRFHRAEILSAQRNARQRAKYKEFENGQA
jgi:hypothetical protein